MSPTTPRRHIVTVSVEDYFQSHDLASQVRYKQWEVFESRIDSAVERTLGFFRHHGVTATYFVSGWTAERYPELVPRIVTAGHEIASAGYSPRRSARATPDSFRNDLRIARELLESQGANRIHGYRSSHWLEDDELWMLDVLAEEGYRYDSSINPVLRRFAGHPSLFRSGEHPHATRLGLSIAEIPISTIGVAGLRLAISGGNYVRQLPHTLLKRSVAWWDAAEDSPLVFYFMPWEFDTEQPHFDVVPWLTDIRHYRGLAKTAWVFDEYMRRYRFQSIAAHLGLPLDRMPRDKCSLTVAPVDAVLPRVPSPFDGITPVTVVVPVFNEAPNIAFLLGTLLRLRRRLADRYCIHLCLVDDGSTDDTVVRVRQHFANVPDFTLLEHGKNRGIAAAIMTGIRASGSEIVCSIDCDCSYDPDILERMIPLVRAADLVTASPYHPEGKTLNVPVWRISLSRTLSRAYRQLVDVRIHTFTSCCRVYRQSVFAPMQLHHQDFLGIAEMLLRAGLQGSVIVELPATLESRMFGQSKMKTAQVIRGHLGLLRQMAAGKLRGDNHTRG